MIVWWIVELELYKCWGVAETVYQYVSLWGVAEGAIVNTTLQCCFVKNIIVFGQLSSFSIPLNPLVVPNNLLPFERRAVGKPNSES